MRVLIDTNVFISYLLTSQQGGVVYTILEAALADQFTLLLPQDLLNEIRVTVTRKPYLVERIPLDALDALLSVLTLISEEILRIENPIPPITRDPKDDYLIAYAIVGEAEYLVTGDKDLLVLEEFDAIKVLTPMQFVEAISGKK